MLAKVSTVEPVASPVCVALETLAVLAVTDAVAAVAVEKSDIVEASCVPVWLARFFRFASVSLAVAPVAIPASLVASPDG